MEEEKKKLEKTDEQFAQNEQKEKNGDSFFGEVFRFAIIAVLIVLPIRLYIAQPFIVSGASMVPSFENGDYLIVDEISYRFEEPKRDDVIIFRFPLDTTKFFIKRIVGLPNETIEMRDGDIIITEPNGDTFIVNEPYREKDTRDILEPITLGKDEYFVMGDNRRFSADSRIWGALEKDLIIGKALVRLFPVSKAGFKF